MDEDEINRAHQRSPPELYGPRLLTTKFFLDDRGGDGAEGTIFFPTYDVSACFLIGSGYFYSRSTYYYSPFVTFVGR